MASECSPYLPAGPTNSIINTPTLGILFIHYWMPGLHWLVHFLFSSHLQPLKKCIPAFPLLNCVTFQSFRECGKWANVFPLFQMDDLSITKDQLSKAVPDQPSSTEAWCTRPAAVDHLSAGSFNKIVNTSGLTLLFLTMAWDFRRTWL